MQIKISPIYARAFVYEEEYQRWSRLGELRSEPEFRDMHTTRLVAGLAGLIRKYKGKFILSKECQKLLNEQGQPGIYPRLFQAFSTLLSQVQPIGDYFPAEKVIRFAYSGHCLERFARFFGLVEIESIGKESYPEQSRVRKLPLLDQVVQFHL